MGRARRTAAGVLAGAAVLIAWSWTPRPDTSTTLAYDIWLTPLAPPVASPAGPVQLQELSCEMTLGATHTPVLVRLRDRAVVAAGPEAHRTGTAHQGDCPSLDACRVHQFSRWSRPDASSTVRPWTARAHGERRTDWATLCAGVGVAALVPPMEEDVPPVLRPQVWADHRFLSDALAATFPAWFVGLLYIAAWRWSAWPLAALATLALLPVLWWLMFAAIFDLMLLDVAAATTAAVLGAAWVLAGPRPARHFTGRGNPGLVRPLDLETL